MTAPDHRDFFISYTGVDKKWATWVADTLEENNYNVFIQAWDFQPGNNFVLQMQNAAQNSDRTLLILSPASLKSLFVGPEWAAAFVQDPSGLDGKLVPIRVEPCHPTGLLAALVHIDLVDLGQEAATTTLLHGLGQDRAKPTTKAPFPGSSVSGSTAAISVSPPGLKWHHLASDLAIRWHNLERNSFSLARTMLEIHAVPVEASRVEVRRLRTLTDDLVSIGRQAQFFSNTTEVAVNSTSDMAMAETAKARYDDEMAGLLTTRSGQLSAWISMPKDGLGTVYDASFVEDQIGKMLRILFQLPVEFADEYAFALAITSPMTLTVNDISVLGNRNSSGGMRMSDQPITVEPQDSAFRNSIVQNFDDVAEELVAQLSAALGKKG